MVVKIITPSDKNTPPGKLAEAELHFTEGILDGLKLIGFHRMGAADGRRAQRHVSARTYSVNGERRSFALLRPAAGDATAQDRVASDSRRVCGIRRKAPRRREARRPL